MISKRIHPHSNGKIFKVIEELAEGLKLLESDSAFVLHAVKQPIEIHVVLVGVQVRVAEEDLSEIYFGYSLVT